MFISAIITFVLLTATPVQTAPRQPMLHTKTEFYELSTKKNK